MKRKSVGVLAMICLLAAMGMSAQAKGKAKGALSGQVNINEASVSQLTMLPGIGVQRAKQVQEYAKAHSFKSADELTEIKGIGPKGVEKLRAYVTVSGPTTAKWVKPAQQ